MRVALRKAPWHGGQREVGRIGDAVADVEREFGRFTIRRADGSTERLDCVFSRTLDASDQIEIVTGGGGGYGPAPQRDGAHVDADLLDGYSSPQA